MNDLFRVAPELDSMISMASAQIVLDTAKDLGVAPRRVTEYPSFSQQAVSKRQMVAFTLTSAPTEPNRTEAVIKSAIWSQLLGNARQTRIMVRQSIRR